MMGGPTRNPINEIKERNATYEASLLSSMEAAAVTANGKPTETPKPINANPAKANLKSLAIIKKLILGWICLQRFLQS